jgi:hypothetical protein
MINLFFIEIGYDIYKYTYNHFNNIYNYFYDNNIKLIINEKDNNSNITYN